MQMGRLWDRVTRCVCTRVESDEPSRGEIGDADGSSPDTRRSRLASLVGCPRPEPDASSTGPSGSLSNVSHEDAVVRFVVDNFPVENVTWQSYYLAVAGVGLAFFLAQRLHVALVNGLDPIVPSIALMALLAFGGAYQLYTREVFFAPPP
ncbi:MAG: hypothetical protein ABEJ22_00855 [Haloferacaceae archaeon]